MTKLIDKVEELLTEVRLSQQRVDDIEKKYKWLLTATVYHPGINVTYRANDDITRHLVGHELDKFITEAIKSDEIVNGGMFRTCLDGMFVRV